MTRLRQGFGGQARAFVMALAAFVVTGGDAIGHVLCGERGEVLADLEKTYAETPEARGLASNGSVIEVLVSPTGGFTIILTRPDGLSCVMATGEGWEHVKKVLPGEGT